MEQWRYRGAVIIGFLCGTVFFLFRGWIWQSEGLISNELMQLAGIALAGALLGCGLTFLQRQSARRASDRHDRTRQIRIVQGQDG